jgi:outer membrane usher protein
MHMPLPLLDADRKLGELVARIDPDDRIWVRRDVLVDMLSETIKPEVAASVRALPATAGEIDLGTLARTGVELTFDRREVALRFAPKADLRTAQSLSLRNLPAQTRSAALSRPALIAGYLNMIGGVDHLWRHEAEPERSGVHLDLQSAVRLGSVVIENDASYDGIVDPQTCPREAICTYEHESGFKRRRSRLVYDLPDRAIRMQAGDTMATTTGLQRISDMLGVAIEKSPSQLQPDQLGQRQTSRKLLIERPSEVIIAVNGAILRQLRLQPGHYDLRDLALVAGNNQIDITVTDDTGVRRTIQHTTYFDQQLLAHGATEWSLAGGIPSYYRDGTRLYVEDAYVGSGFYRWGLSERVTAEASAQVDQNVRMIGAGALTGTPWGVLGVQTAFSQSSAGEGYAISVNWDLLRFRGLLSDIADGRESLRLSAEYRSRDFRLPGDFLTTASGLIYPQFNYWLRLMGSYTVPIGWGLSATLAARYQFANDDEPILAPNQVRGDRYGIDLAFSGPVTESVSGSLTLGYSNESYLRYTRTSASSSDPEFRIMARAFVRLPDGAHVTASHDTLNRQTLISGYRAQGNGVGRWETTVDAYNGDGTREASIGATAAYHGNRAEARIAHNTTLSELGWSGPTARLGQQRTSLRIGSSIAFADGKVGIGAPIRGQGFAIVDAHETLAGKDITVGTAEHMRARADAWGPAVVTDLPAYSSTTLPVDVAELPLGYSLGAGTFDIVAPYKGGYALEVGSDHSVSAFGTLVDRGGAPLALRSGIAASAGAKARQVTVLTNAAGRFAAEGLSAGRWTIEVSVDDSTLRYVLDVPKGTDGLHRAGLLRPTEAGAKTLQTHSTPTAKTELRGTLEAK